MFLFFAATMFVVMVGVVGEESDMPLHLLDDLAIFLIMLGVVGFLAVSWKKQTSTDLRRQNNVVLGAAVVALAFQILAFPLEASDPMDFGNEIPFLIILLATIVNRFV